MESTVQIKVGDKVKITPSRIWHTIKNAGTVLEIDDNHYLNIKVDFGKPHGECWIRDKRLNIVE